MNIRNDTLHAYLLGNKEKIVL